MVTTIKSRKLVNDKAESNDRYSRTFIPVNPSQARIEISRHVAHDYLNREYFDDTSFDKKRYSYV